MILLSVFCVVLSLDFGVATPQVHRFKESLERDFGEPTNPYYIPNNQNEVISRQNQKNVLMQNEDYEQFNTNNNPAVFRNENEQPNVIPENKEYNQITAERNVDNLNDESLRPSYIASPPQVKRIQTFRPKNGENQRANIPTMGDILSEVDNSKNDVLAKESIAQIIQERNPANQVINKYDRRNSPEPENIYDKKEEATVTQFDVPAATPEYIQSLFNDYKHPQKNNVKSTVTNWRRNDISNKNFQTNSKNENVATFQNPSAEILYETGQAQPYEISDPPSFNSRGGNRHASNILNDKQRLKNLYLSSKPKKHYMIVYPDGRVEQVDNLDKIQKKHPNYVMLSAKELLQHGNPNQKVSTALQGSVVKDNAQITTTTTTPTTTTSTTTTTTTMKPELNSVQNTKDGQIDKGPQTVKEQTLPYQIELLPVSTETPVTSTSAVPEMYNVTKYSEDEVLRKLNTENDIQDQLQENGISDPQEKNNLNNYETTSPGAVVTTSDISSIQISTSSTDAPDTEDTVTTARSTLSTPTETTEIFTKNISYSLAMNNTESDDLSNIPEDENTEEKNNTTSSSNLTNTTYERILAGENTTPTIKQESNEEEERTRNTATKTIKKNSNTAEKNIQISNGHYETDTRNTSQSLDSSSNNEESNIITKSSNRTIITFEDGTNSDGNTFHTETIITDYNNESGAQNSKSINVSSSEESTTSVSNSNKTEITNSSETENTENNTNTFNVSSSQPLINNTLDFSEKDVNNTDAVTITILSNVTSSELDGNKNDDNKPHKPDINSDPVYKDASPNTTVGEAYNVSNKGEESKLNKLLIANVQRNRSIYTDDDDTHALTTGNQDAVNEEDPGTATVATNDNKVISQSGAVSLYEKYTTATDAASDDSYYLYSPPKGPIEDDEEDVTRDEIRSEITNNDNIETELQGGDAKNGANESSFWFNANDSFWNKLLNSNEHNSFYFLFPRPKPDTRETKKTIYPNGTTIIETIETVDKGDGDTISSRTVFTCGNCTTCEKTL